ncbi:J domain-containing protein [Limnohabitans sp.]|uniref:J domain-containing protein n=1 Tax=Limnohabitans sp. TaxID=1907725 RepID=UPI0025B86628|nr:J domain-containing protein [Limnohabitans sp.]
MISSTEAHQDAAISLSALMVQPSDQVPLTPAQERFNDLLARIEQLSGLIERLQAWSDRHRYAHIQALRESVQLAQAHRKSLLLFVHERLQTADFTDRQQRMARGLVRGLIDQLAASADPQVQALADLYVSEEDTQETAQEQAEAAQRLRERIEEALGQPIEKAGQYQTPEEMMQAGMRQWQRQQEADEQRKAAKRAAKKAQKQAQKKSAAAEKGEVPPALLREADAKSAIRTVFRQLASALHPDREPDEQERLRKTALMSEVNAAYEKNDLSTLLRLQMQVTKVNPQNSARMADAQLIAMASLLKEQVTALEDDLDALQSRLSRELCVPVRAEAEEASIMQALQRIQADQRHSADSLEADLRRIQNDAELKRWLKEQWQLAKEQVQSSTDF